MKRPIQTALLFLCTACTEEPKPPIDISSEADNLISELQGTWFFKSELVTDCPGDDDGFDGMERLFERTHDSLLVGNFPHEGDVSHFHPTGPNTLETMREDSILGCVISQTAELDSEVKVSGYLMSWAVMLQTVAHAPQHLKAKLVDIIRASGSAARLLNFLLQQLPLSSRQKCHTASCASIPSLNVLHENGGNETNAAAALFGRVLQQVRLSLCTECAAL